MMRGLWGDDSWWKQQTWQMFCRELSVDGETLDISQEVLPAFQWGDFLGFPSRIRSMSSLLRSPP